MGFPDWGYRLPEKEARRVRDAAEVMGEGCHQKDCFWRGYRMDGEFFIGLSDSLTMWKVDERVMSDHCMEPEDF